MSLLVFSLPDGWREAFNQSKRRYLDDPRFFEAGPIRRCVGGLDCPQLMRGVCMASQCIFRYPTETDLFEHMEAAQ